MERGERNFAKLYQIPFCSTNSPHSTSTFIPEVLLSSMATLECSYTATQDPIASRFDPLAVPSAPPSAFPHSTTISRAPHTLQDGQDLIDLGEEQLFSGSRSRGSRLDQDQLRTGSSDLQQAPTSRTAPQPVQKVRVPLHSHSRGST